METARRNTVPEIIAETSVIDPVKNSSSEKLRDLTTWFPSEERKREITALPPEEKAEYVADVLGRITGFIDAIEGLEHYREQDGSTTAAHLGLSRNDAALVYPHVLESIRLMDTYTDNLINVDLQKNYALIASKIKTAGQAMGLQRALYRVPENANSGVGVLINFRDGSAGLTDGIDGVLYLEGSVERNVPVEMVSYNPEEKNLSLTLPHPSEDLAA